MKPAQVADHGGDMDAVERARLKVQKKSWRAKCVLSEDIRRQKMMLLCFTTHPIERLAAEITHSDGKERRLWDVVFSDNLNPFVKCRKSLAKLQRDGAGVLLAPMFESVPQEQRANLLTTCSQMIGGFIAQTAWRFKEYECFPLRWAAWTHPAKTLAQRDSVVDDWFSLCCCCRAPGWCGKLRAWCGDDRQMLKGCASYKEAVHGFVNGFAFTGMCMERLLASFRNWAGSQHDPKPDVERWISAGFIGQLLREHKAIGGYEPRAVSRGQLLSQGVPLRAMKKAKTQSKPASSFVLFMKEQREARDRLMGAATREDKASYKAWEAAKIAEWKELPDELKDIYTQQALTEHHWRRTPAEQDIGEAVSALRRKTSTRSTFLARDGSFVFFDLIH